MNLRLDQFIAVRPLIASPCCGDFIQDGVRGLILNEVNQQRITPALRSGLLHLDHLAESLDRNCCN